MNLSVGIVGLPNVGKSTLFNALLKRQIAFVANYPFATIEPNIGVVPVPDSRLEVLAKITAEEILKPIRQAQGRQVQDDISKWPPIKPATVEFVDIAGLVKGASEGEGLGNKFLSHIREVKVICHLVRVFTDPDIIREGSVDPKSDFETIETELLLADLQSLVKQRESKEIKINPTKLSTIKKLISGLDNGIAARDIAMDDIEKEESKGFSLLTAKPEIVVLNVSEEQYNPEGIRRAIKKYYEMLKQVQHDSNNIIVISAKIEAELAALSEEEQREYLKDLGLETSGLERLIQKAYATLGLISFLTAGEKEVRAWTIKKGTNAQNAAGEIHTDFIKKFIKAEVVAYEDFVNPGGFTSPNPPAGGEGGWKKAREAGRARLEGRDYIIKDGDVVEFKIGS
jgi:hypothetical protein